MSVPCVEIETSFLHHVVLLYSQCDCRATKMVYGVEPDLTREGGSIPVTLTLQVTSVQPGMMLLTRD